MTNENIENKINEIENRLNKIEKDFKMYIGEDEDSALQGEIKRLHKDIWSIKSSITEIENRISKLEEKQ